MLLIGVKKDAGWLYSRWQLTWGAGWNAIVHGACRLYADLKDPEIYVDGERLPEQGKLMIRGVSKTLGIPVMVNFTNQTLLVDVTLPVSPDVCESTDYETFNRALAPYVDSLELSMFTNY